MTPSTAEKIITSIGISASRRGKFPSLHLRYLHRLGVNNRPPETTVQRRRSRNTATKETRKATTKQWRTTSKSNKKPGKKKNTKTKNKETVSVCISFFHQVFHQKQNCEAPHRKQNTRLGQNFQNPKKKSKHIHLILSFFSPLGQAGNRRKLTRKKHQPSRTMAEVRAPKTNKEALRNEK